MSALIIDNQRYGDAWEHFEFPNVTDWMLLGLLIVFVIFVTIEWFRFSRKRKINDVQSPNSR